MIDVTRQNSTMAAIYRYVADIQEKPARILHIEGGAGEFAQLFADQGHEVTVTSSSQQDAALAGTRQLNVINMRFGSDPIPAQMRGGFDVAVMHLKPEQLASQISALSEVTAQGGHIAVTAKNLMHGSNRIAFLAGEGGDGVALADLKAAVVSAGFEIEKIYSTVREVLDANIETALARVPENVVDWVRHQPGALDDEYLLIAKKTGATPSAAVDKEAEIAVTALIAYPKVEDKYTEAGRRARTEAIHGKIREAELERLRERESELLRLASQVQIKEQIIRNDAQYKNDLEQQLAAVRQQLQRNSFKAPKEKARRFVQAVSQKLGVR